MGKPRPLFGARLLDSHAPHLYKLQYYTMAGSLILVLLCVALADSAVSSSNGPLPRAYGSPINVDAEVDCAVKVLAWEYAKKLLPRVSSVVTIYYLSNMVVCCPPSTHRSVQN